METLENRPPVHLGRNTQRIREILGMKQSALADITGMSQQNISKLEQSEAIPDETLEKLAEGLGVTPGLIKNFNEEKALYNIQSNINYHDYSVNSSQQYQPNTNHHPIEQVTAMFEKLLQSERARLDVLEKTTRALSELAEEIRRGKK